MMYIYIYAYMYTYMYIYRHTSDARFRMSRDDNRALNRNKTDPCSATMNLP